MRRVVESELVRARVRRAIQYYPKFKLVWESAVIWSLARGNDLPGTLIPGTKPPTFAFQTNAWRAVGIPPIRVSYVEIEGGIELTSLALFDE